MATLRASTSTRTSWATPLTITGRSIEFSLICIRIGYRRLLCLSIQIAVWAYRFFRWIDSRWIDAADVFLEYLPEPVAQWFGFAAGALDDEDFVALRAFARSGHPHLERGNQFRLIMHVVMLPQICTRDIIAEGTIVSEIATNHVGADVLICPVERSSTLVRIS